MEKNSLDVSNLDSAGLGFIKDSKSYYYLLIPGRTPLPKTLVSSLKAVLKSITDYSNQLFQAPLEILFVDTETLTFADSNQEMYPFQTKKERQGLHFVFNASFVLYEQPAIEKVFEVARVNGEAMLGSRSTCDIQAYCFNARGAKTKDVLLAVNCLLATSQTENSQVQELFKNKEVVFPTQLVEEFPPTFDAFVLEDVKYFTNNPYSAFHNRR